MNGLGAGLALEVLEGGLVVPDTDILNNLSLVFVTVSILEAAS